MIPMLPFKIKMERYELLRVFSNPRSGAFKSFIAEDKETKKQVLVTVYDITYFQDNLSLVTKRIKFICRNKHLFACVDAFFDVNIKNHDDIKITNMGRYLKKFIIVEPLPMKTVADKMTNDTLSARQLKEGIKDIIILFKNFHSHDFVYGYLSPVTVIVSDKHFKLRPPPLNPFLSPKDAYSPTFLSKCPKHRSSAEIKFALPPEFGLCSLSSTCDSWSFGVFLADTILCKGASLFASVSKYDMNRRVQQVLGKAPDYLGWEIVNDSANFEIPSCILQFLSYNYHSRPKFNLSLFDSLTPLLKQYPDSCIKSESSVSDVLSQKECIE